MVQGRMAYLKAELDITEAQSAAWNEYVNAVNAQMLSMQGSQQSMMEAMQSGPPTAGMDAHVKAMEAMSEALKALKPATETLYTVLTPDQKQKADHLLGMGCCMMM
jgi:LTXXQ motif family protein